MIKFLAILIQVVLVAAVAFLFFQTLLAQGVITGNPVVIDIGTKILAGLIGIAFTPVLRVINSWRQQRIFAVLCNLILLGTLIFLLFLNWGNVTGWIKGTRCGFDAPPSSIGTFHVWLDSNPIDGCETIGVSDGSFPFDLNSDRKDVQEKLDAAQALKNNPSRAEEIWREAATKDPSDAEAKIYLADQLAIQHGNYVTIIIGTILSGANIAVGRDDLQGAYLAQQKYNDNHDLQIRLLIANAGNTSGNITLLAQQILQLVRNPDEHVVGVMGWPFSSFSTNMSNILSKQGVFLPMVSPSASSDDLTGARRPSYFFTVAAPDWMQAQVAEQYAIQKLHAHKFSIFLDPTDEYSADLGHDFENLVRKAGLSYQEEQYTVGQSEDFSDLLQGVQAKHPELIFFSGYGSDARTFIDDLSTTSGLAEVKVLGGDGLYLLRDPYPRSAYGRLYFTAFAFPDEWTFVCRLNKISSCTQPSFFKVYSSTFGDLCLSGTYGCTRADADTMLSYDATSLLLTALQTTYANHQNDNSSQLRQEIQQALTDIKMQGVTGYIQFTHGVSVHRGIVVLRVDRSSYTQIDQFVGCLQVNVCEPIR